MTGPICHWCGQYMNTFDEHDEDECYRQRQREIYARGGAAAKAELAKAQAAAQEAE